MNQKPSIVIVSSSSTKPKSIIRLLTHNAHIQEDENVSDKITHPWKIDTKYYEAEVNLVGITESYLRTPEFNENVEALIIHMDSNKESGLEDLRKWEDLENDCDPEVKLLLSNYCNNETKITHGRATEWCLKHGYELIELYPTISTDDDSEDEIIQEKTGVDRVIEALGTHVWPNLIMKDKEKVTSKKAEELESLAADDGLDEFADLFQRLHVMKESISSMPMQQRKQCAEEMVTAFWKAIGGDEEELADL